MRGHHLLLKRLEQLGKLFLATENRLAMLLNLVALPGPGWWTRAIRRVPGRGHRLWHIGRACGTLLTEMGQRVLLVEQFAEARFLIEAWQRRLERRPLHGAVERRMEG